MTSEISNNKETTRLKKPSLPNSWIICRSSTYPDTIYYFNTNTGCSTWELPGLVKKQSNQAMTAERSIQTTSTFSTLNDTLKPFHKPVNKSKQKTNLWDVTVEQPWYIKHSKENSSKSYPEPTGEPPNIAISRNLSENESGGSNYNIDFSPDNLISKGIPEELVIVTNVSQGDGDNDESDSNLWRGSTDVSLHTRFKIFNNVAEFTRTDEEEGEECTADDLEDSNKSLEPNDLRLLLRARREGGATDFDPDDPEEVEEEQYQNMEEDVIEHDIQDTEEEAVDKESEVVMDGVDQNTTSPLKRVSFDANTKTDSIENLTSAWEDDFNSESPDSSPLATNVDKLASLSQGGVGNGESENPAVGNRWYIAVDSSVWLSNLTLIKILFNAKEGKKCAPTILVPWRVLHELDKMGLTDQDMRGLPASRIGWGRPSRARWAKTFINENIKPTSYVGARLVGESCQEANQKLFQCTGPDDEIINCCLRYASNSHHVIVLSNDKNLCNKALVNNIHAFTVHQMKELLYDNKHQDSFDSETSPVNMKKSHLSLFKRTVNMNDKQTKNTVNIVEPTVKPKVTKSVEIAQNMERKYIEVGSSIEKTWPFIKDKGNGDEKNGKILGNDIITGSKKPKTTKIILKRKRAQDLITYDNDSKRTKIQFDNPKEHNDLITKEGLMTSNEIVNTSKKIFVKKNTYISTSNVNAERDPKPILNIVKEQKTDSISKQTKPIKVTIDLSFEELMKKKKDNMKKSVEIDQSTSEKEKTEKNEKKQPKALQQTITRTLPTESFSAFIKKNLNKTQILQNSSDVSEGLFSEYSATPSDDIHTNISESISSVDETPKVDLGQKNKDVNSRLTTTVIQKRNPLDILVDKTIFKIPQDLPQRKKINITSKEANQMIAVKVTVDKTSTEAIDKVPPKRERQKIVFDVDAPENIKKPIQRVQPVAPAKKERVKIVFDLDKDETKPMEIKQNTLIKDNSSFATVDNKCIPKIQLSMGNKSVTVNNIFLPKKQVTFNTSVNPNKKLSPMKKNQPFTIISNNENTQNFDNAPNFTNETVNSVPLNNVFNLDSLNLRHFTNKSNVPNLNSKPPIRTNFKVTFGSANETVSSMESLSDWHLQSQQAFTNNINTAFEKNKQKNLKDFEAYNTDVQCDNEVFKLTETNNKNVDPNRVNSMQVLRTDMMKGSSRDEKRVEVQPKMLKFSVNSYDMKNRIEARLDEWLCRLWQIMENILYLELERSLRLTPKYCLDILKPPWSLHEALVSLNMVFKQAGLSASTAVSKNLPVEAVVDALAQKISESFDRKPFRMTADEYMDIYSHSYNVLYYLKSNHTAEEDYTIALESLELIMTDIKNTDTDANYDFAIESDDRTPRLCEEPPQFIQQNKKGYNRINEIKQYIKKHFPSAISDENFDDVSQGNCTEIQQEMTESVVQNKNVEVDKIYRKVPDRQNISETNKSAEANDLDALNYECDGSSEHEISCRDQVKKSVEFEDHVRMDLGSMNLSMEQTYEPASMNQRTTDCIAPVGPNRISMNVDHQVYNDNNYCHNRNTDKLVEDNLKNEAVIDAENNVLRGIKMTFLHSYMYCTKFSESLGAKVQDSAKQSLSDLPEIDAGCDSVQIKKLSDAIRIMLSRLRIIPEEGSTSKNAYDNLARAINDLIKLLNLKVDSLHSAGLKKLFERRRSTIIAYRQHFQSLHNALVILLMMKK